MKPVSARDDKSPNSEGSAVRPRGARSTDPELAVGSREVRMAQKVMEAEALLRERSPRDDRHRLLQTALHRKDEALLDAILSTLRQR